MMIASLELNLQTHLSRPVYDAFQEVLISYCIFIFGWDRWPDMLKFTY